MILWTVYNFLNSWKYITYPIICFLTYEIWKYFTSSGSHNKRLLQYLLLKCPCCDSKKALFPYGLCVAQGLRDYMEDRFVIENDKRSNCTIYGVFDGHGGDEAAQFTVDHLPQILLNNPNFSTNPNLSLLESFLTVDDSFTKISKNHHINSGTCANLVVVNKKKIVTANTGDSRSILVKKNATVEELSVDHKPGRIDEKERIEKIGGRVISLFSIPRVQGLLAVSRAIGDVQLKPYVICDPDITTHQIDDQDLCVITASDGLWDVITNGLAGIVARQELIVGKQTCQKLAETLVDMALQKGSGDNITCIVIDLSN